MAFVARCFCVKRTGASIVLTEANIKNKIEDHTFEWCKGTRYYNLHIQPNLFGGLSVIKTWGSSISRRVGHKITFCDSDADIVKILEETTRKRKSRDYNSLHLSPNYPSIMLLNLVANSKIKVLEELIIDRRNINLSDNDGYTALMWSVHHKDYEITSHLIAHNVNLDSVDDDGHTALMVAAWKGQTRIVKLLIKAGANINIRDKKLYSALFYSILGNHPEVSELLSQAGAILNDQETKTLKEKKLENPYQQCEILNG
jgi:ankyrin repeat protein